MIRVGVVRLLVEGRGQGLLAVVAVEVEVAWGDPAVELAASAKKLRVPPLIALAARRLMMMPRHPAGQ